MANFNSKRAEFFENKFHAKANEAYFTTDDQSFAIKGNADNRAAILKRGQPHVAGVDLVEKITREQYNQWKADQAAQSGAPAGKELTGAPAVVGKDATAQLGPTEVVKTPVEIAQAAVDKAQADYDAALTGTDDALKASTKQALTLAKGRLTRVQNIANAAAAMPVVEPETKKEETPAANPEPKKDEPAERNPGGAA